MPIEIRLRWNVVGRLNLINEPIDGGTWCVDTPEKRKNLEVIAEAVNEAYGEGSHLIETRAA
jgi:hypothetical protein